jgi:predicted lipid-binding transport protein (Tim44 family)
MIKPGMMMPMMLAALLASAAHAAEPSSAGTRERGTLSQEATAAGPAVDTSAMPPSAAEATSPNATRPAEQDAPATSQSSSRRESAGGPQAVVRSDRLDLDTTVVTGNRELPKVLYIVPWKKSDLGELPSQPFNTLLDEALTPVDRDVFRREVTYYGAVSGAADAAASGSASQAERSEK